MSSQKIVPTLHHLTSSQSHRCLWMLEELAESYGIEYKLKIYERGNSKDAAALKQHFFLGKSPILTVEEDGLPSKDVYQLPDHPGILTESRLILDFLAREFGQGMWEPETEIDRRQNEFFTEFALSTLALKANFALIFEIIPSMMPWGLRHLLLALVYPVVYYWKTDIDPCIKLMEDALSEERPWFAGRKMGIADFNMIWGMELVWHRSYMAKEKYPKVVDWHRRVTERPAFKQAVAKGGFYNLATFIRS